jgi:amidase
MAMASQLRPFSVFATPSAQDEAPELPRPLDFSPFEEALKPYTSKRIAQLDKILLEASCLQLKELLDRGEVDSSTLVCYYLARIREHNDLLRAVIELNPDALRLASLYDNERGHGLIRGPLHGIPILLKDLIGTGDRMHNTAGAAALIDAQCDRDSFLVHRLRTAGLLVLGKANLSEWANWLAYGTPGGYSAVGGQTVNPYGIWLDPSGSSSGSAVATAANLVPLAIGTETRGSILSPAGSNSVVGMHPSIGSISRDRVIPCWDQIDTPGPIAKNVTDLALLQSVLTGMIDPNDRLSAEAEPLIGTDYTSFLKPDALAGKRVGFGYSDWISDELRAQAIADLETAGAEVIDIAPPGYDDGWAVDWLIDVGMQVGVDAYLAETGGNGWVQTLADVIAFNDQDPDLYCPWGQSGLLGTQNYSVPEEEAIAIFEDYRRGAREYIDGLLTEYEVDVLISINHEQAPEYACGGCPAVTVPAGYFSDNGAPVGITFLGPFLTDGEVIGYAYAYEQVSKRRMPPDLDHLHEEMIAAEEATPVEEDAGDEEDWSEETDESDEWVEEDSGEASRPVQRA